MNLVQGIRAEFFADRLEDIRARNKRGEHLLPVENSVAVQLSLQISDEHLQSVGPHASPRQCTMHENDYQRSNESGDCRRRAYDRAAHRRAEQDGHHVIEG